MIRALLITCLLVFLALFATPQTAMAQIGEAAVEAATETIPTLSDDDIERAYRQVKRDEAYQYEYMKHDLRNPLRRKKKKRQISRFTNRRKPKLVFCWTKSTSWPQRGVMAKRFTRCFSDPFKTLIGTVPMLCGAASPRGKLAAFRF